MDSNIFLIDERGRAVELRNAQYQDEDAFQRLIADHPELLNCVLPAASEPQRWIFAAREVGVPDHSEGCAQWFLDHLLLSYDGVPTLVEVKRSTDSRIRREVVGQMLDYAANGCAYWDASVLRENYEAWCRQAGCDPLSEICPDQESVDAYWDRVGTNLRNRKVRLLFVADQIPDSLKRIIEFLNEQMADTEVLGVELCQYVSDQKHRILVPNVIGKTTPAQEMKRQAGFAWTEESYLERARTVTDEETANVCHQLLREFEKMGCQIYWGRGRKQAGFVPTYMGTLRHQLCAVYIYDSHISIEIYFEHFKPPFSSKEKQQELMAQFNEIPGVRLTADRLGKRPSFNCAVLKDTESFRRFMAIYQDMLGEIQANEQLKG